jgi:hypothetical protein
MNTARLVLLTISYVAVMLGASYAAPSNSASQQASSESPTSAVSGHPRNEHAASPGSAQRRDYGHGFARNQPRSHASLTKANFPKQLPNNRERLPSGNALYQPGSRRSVVAAKERLTPHETIKHGLSVRPPTVVRATGPSLGNVPHHGPNPAVIGGFANSKTGNIGAIDGTRMARKP